MSIDFQNIDRIKKSIQHQLKIKNEKSKRKKRLQFTIIIIMTFAVLYLFDII